MSLSAGWTFDYTLETLTMTRLAALRKTWRIHPPAHKLLAAMCGYKPAVPETKLSAGDDPSGIGSLIAQFPNGRVPASR